MFTPSDHSCQASNKGLSSKPVCRMCFHCGRPSWSSSFSGENQDQKNLLKFRKDFVQKILIFRTSHKVSRQGWRAWARQDNARVDLPGRACHLSNHLQLEWQGSFPAGPAQLCRQAIRWQDNRHPTGFVHSMRQDNHCHRLWVNIRYQVRVQRQWMDKANAVSGGKNNPNAALWLNANAASQSLSPV